MLQAVADGHPQLTIPLHQQALHRLQNFHVGDNVELVGRITRLDRGDDGPGLAIWGEPGSGRTHLLQAACHFAEEQGRKALYLPLALLPRDAAVLEGLTGGLLAVDDLDAWLGERELEAALMALYQEQIQTGGALLVSAAESTQRLTFRLPDLASRIRALPGFQLKPPDDDGLKRILADRALRQGLTLSAGVLDFWLHRAPRSLPVLLAQLEMLDAQALAEQRRVTIPLIKEVLGL